MEVVLFMRASYSGAYARVYALCTLSLVVSLSGSRNEIARNDGTWIPIARIVAAEFG